MRKRGIVISLLLILTLLVSACGNGNNNNTNGTNNTSNVPNESQTNNETGTQGGSEKKVTDGLDREVNVPADPTRIAALHNLGELIALGVKPIASTDYYIDKFDPEQVEGIESVGAIDPEFEKLMTLQPDLIIISSYMAPETLEQLELIAPTFATKFGLTPDEQLSILANLLDKQEEEQAWHEKYEAKAAAVREQIAPYKEEGESAVVLQFYEKTIYQHAPRVFASLYDGAGFVVPEQVQATTETAAISEEAIIEYAADADRMFLIVEDTNDQSRYNELKETVWKNIPAVKNDQVYLVQSGRWNDYSTASMEWILDDLVTLLVEE